MISTVYKFSHESALKVLAIMHGKEKLLISNELLSEISDATKILIEAYKNRDNSRKEYDFYISMVETFLMDYHCKTPEAFVHFIRSLTMNNIFIRYDDVPYFRNIVTIYAPLVRYARNINFDEYQKFEAGIML